MLVPTHAEPLWGVWWGRIVTWWKLIVRFIYFSSGSLLYFSLPSVPAPTTVTITVPLGVITGSTVTLTCAVELSPAVDVPVTVYTEWIGPPDVIFMPANPLPAVMVNTTTYINTVSVGAARSGSYVCQATVTSGGTTYGYTDITVGMYTYLTAFLSDNNKHKINHA